MTALSDFDTAMEEMRDERRKQAGESFKHRIRAATLRAIISDPFDGKLSPQLLKVALLMARGYKTPEIAEELELANNTIKVYRAKVGEKLGISPSRVPGYVLDELEAAINE